MGNDHSKFAVFILTHGRPDRVITVGTLKKAGYTGRTYFIVDDEDTSVDEYRARYGAENVIHFDKSEWVARTDYADSFGDEQGAVVYARNACFSIARGLGLDYFLELDDDYNYFRYRYVEDGVENWPWVRSFDAVADAMLTFLDGSGAATVAFAQGGDLLGGGIRGGRLCKGLLRKAMNSFFFRTDRPLAFVGRINEDVSTYVTEGARGVLFLTVMGVSLDQSVTQQAGDGLTDIYLRLGTYVKSFYTVMMAPSCVIITGMGASHRRVHHRVKLDHAVPKILSEKYRKATLAP